MEDYFQSVICEDRECHSATHMLADPDPVSSTFLTARGEWCCFVLVVDGFIEIKPQHEADVISLPRGGTKGGATNVVRMTIVEDKTHIV